MAVRHFSQDVVQKVVVQKYKKGVRFTGEAKCEGKNEFKISFIFGWGERDKIKTYVDKYRHTGESKNWRGATTSIQIRDESWLEREMAWHSYYLRSMLVKDYYFECHFLPQGSAYSYLHGMHGRREITCSHACR